MYIGHDVLLSEQDTLAMIEIELIEMKWVVL